MIIIEDVYFPHGFPARIAVKMANGAVWYVNGESPLRAVQNVVDFVCEQNSSVIFQARALAGVK